MQTGMNIGTVVDKDSLGAITDAIVRIMETKADQDTIRAAFGALSRMSCVEGVTIQNCNIIGDKRVDVVIESNGDVVVDDAR